MAVRGSIGEGVRWRVHDDRGEHPDAHRSEDHRRALVTEVLEVRMKVDDIHETENDHDVEHLVEMVARWVGEVDAVDESWGR